MRKYLIAAGIIISGIFWYLSCDLSGDYWYMLWLAPIPVLLISFHTCARHSFVLSFTAYTIGRLSWLSYLLKVLPIPLAIFFTLFLPLIFSIVVLLTRKIVLTNQNGWSAFAFPVFWSLFEFLLFKFSPDGTAGSIAYSQANFLPIVQVASITGILGITFLVTLFPSAIIVAVYYRGKKKVTRTISYIFFLVIISILFGLTRMMNGTTDQNSFIAGLAVIDEKFHTETNHPVDSNEIHVADLYAEQVASLAKEGAQVVVLPEKMINLTPTNDSIITKIFEDAAIDNHITIIGGFTRFQDSTKKNIALVISDTGNFSTEYQKVHLFEGEKYSGFSAGKNISVFEFNNNGSGVAICKDMDYQNFIRNYSEKNLQVMFVPAWDFVQDGWLHSRMAILRSAENGFALVRTARQGELTISDYRGKVLSETSSTNNYAASLIAGVPLYSAQTIYSKFGDWFGFVIVISALYFIISILISREKSHMLKKVQNAEVSDTTKAK